MWHLTRVYGIKIISRESDYFSHFRELVKNSIIIKIIEKINNPAAIITGLSQKRSFPIA